MVGDQKDVVIYYKVNLVSSMTENKAEQAIESSNPEVNLHNPKTCKTHKHSFRIQN